MSEEAQQYQDSSPVSPPAGARGAKHALRQWTQARLKEVAWQKTLLEVEALQSQGLIMSGCAFAALLFVKGIPNDQERRGAALLSGKDGQALLKAIEALGYEPTDWAALLTLDAWGNPLLPERLREAVEVVCPATVIALDEPARLALCEAYAKELTLLGDISQALLEPGVPSWAAGLRLMSLGGFEAALASSQKKQVMWARLKKLPPLGEPY